MVIGAGGRIIERRSVEESIMSERWYLNALMSGGSEASGKGETRVHRSVNIEVRPVGGEVDFLCGGNFADCAVESGLMFELEMPRTLVASYLTSSQPVGRGTDMAPPNRGGSSKWWGRH